MDNVHMNTNLEDIGTFHECEVNFATEYHSARKLMGTKGTCLDTLYEKVTLLYLNTPPKWIRPYQYLLNEIEDRQLILATLTA